MVGNRPIIYQRKLIHLMFFEDKICRRCCKLFVVLRVKILINSRFEFTESCQFVVGDGIGS